MAESHSILLFPLRLLSPSAFYFQKNLLRVRAEAKRFLTSDDHGNPGESQGRGFSPPDNVTMSDIIHLRPDCAAHDAQGGWVLLTVLIGQ